LLTTIIPEIVLNVVPMRSGGIAAIGIIIIIIHYRSLRQVLQLDPLFIRLSRTGS